MPRGPRIAPAHRLAHPLDDDERHGIVLAVNSAFRKLKNLYERIVPVFDDYGFKPPSAGVVARDLSEKIETSIVQHCNTFRRGRGHADLERFERPWEVKICKGSGLTINQSKRVEGENYIVVNYVADSVVTRIWILWDSKDEFFSPRRTNANARTVNFAAAREHVEVIEERAQARVRSARNAPAEAAVSVSPSRARRTSPVRRTGSR
jgi:hypothetical protein